MARRNKQRNRTVRKPPAAASSKKRNLVRWIPDVSASGELVLRRTQRTTQPETEDMNYPFSQGLTFVARRWRNLMNEELRAAGQSQARWGTLYWITVFGDTVNQTELAERIGVEQQTLGRVLRDLESAGVITRASGAGDRRAKVIRLTAAAEPLLRKINAIQERVRAQLLSGIARRELETCMAVFAKILSNVDRH
jgi:MarR family transcriptional regulator, transcriptional regulator for hemolysin